VGPDSTNSVAFSDDGRFVAAASGAQSMRAMVCVWNADTGELVDQRPRNGEILLGLAFGPECTLYAWSLHGMIYGWDLRTQSEPSRISILEWAMRDFSKSHVAPRPSWLMKTLNHLYLTAIR
jgi:WD40 repeat protein